MPSKKITRRVRRDAKPSKRRKKRGPIRLSDRGIKAMKPAEGKREAQADSVSPGLTVRVTDSGAATFFFVFRSGTKNTSKVNWFRIGEYPDMSLKTARERNDLLRTNYRVHGINPILEKKRALAAETFAELADAFVEKLRADGKRSWRNYHRVLIGGALPDAKRTLKKKRKSKHIPISKLWEGRKLPDIKPRDVRDVIESIKSRGATIHANRTFAYIRQAFKFALHREWIEHSPCDAIDNKMLLTEERERHRVLSEDEIRVLWTALDGETPIIADTIRVLLLTWQRSGEVFRMRWDELRDDGWWELPETRTKNGLPHRVYLAKPVRDILERRLTEQRESKKYADSEWVFRSPKRPKEALGHITKAIQRLREKTEIDFRPHDLRRSAASLAAKFGVPELTIPKVLGHVPTGVTRKHYNLHGYDGEKKAALELWAREIDRILTEEPQQAGKVVSFFARA